MQFLYATIIYSDPIRSPHFTTKWRPWMVLIKQLPASTIRCRNNPTFSLQLLLLPLLSTAGKGRDFSKTSEAFLMKLHSLFFKTFYDLQWQLVLYLMMIVRLKSHVFVIWVHFEWHFHYISCLFRLTEWYILGWSDLKRSHTDAFLLKCLQPFCQSVTFFEDSNFNEIFFPLTMNKSLSSKSTARRKAFSKRWCLQREGESVKEQHPDKKQKQSSNLKHILWLKMDRWIGQRYTFLSSSSLHTNTHLDPHKPLHTKLSIIELRVAGPLPIIQN